MIEFVCKGNVETSKVDHRLDGRGAGELRFHQLVVLDDLSVSGQKIQGIDSRIQ